MLGDNFIIFQNSGTGARIDRVLYWLLTRNVRHDKNGNPVNELSLGFDAPGGDEGLITLTITDPEDVKAFFAKIESELSLVGFLQRACEKALEHIDQEYNEGDHGDPRPHWGELQDLDDLHNLLSEAVARARGDSFVPRK